MADFTEDNSRGIPVDRQITFPSITGDLIWDIDQLPLTRVHSGDCDNSVYISFLGDNREVSYDSRSFGLVNLTEIKGKVLK